MSQQALADLGGFLLTVFAPLALQAAAGLLGIYLTLLLSNSIRRIFSV